MGVDNKLANTFSREIIYSSSLTKTLNIPGRLVSSISASQTRSDDPAPLTDKTNVYQINSSREIIEQTIKWICCLQVYCAVNGVYLEETQTV